MENRFNLNTNLFVSVLKITNVYSQFTEILWSLDIQKEKKINICFFDKSHTQIQLNKFL